MLAVLNALKRDFKGKLCFMLLLPKTTQKNITIKV